MTTGDTPLHIKKAREQSDHDILLLVQYQLEHFGKNLVDLTVGINHMDKRLYQIEQHMALNEANLVSLRQDLTTTRLKTDGLGKSLDDLRDAYEHDRARLGGQLIMLRWVLGGTWAALGLVLAVLAFLAQTGVI